MKKIFGSLFFACVFLFMLCNPKTTVSGAQTGLLLWFHSIIPALLPFMILSSLMVATNAISFFTFFLGPIANKIYGISSNGSYALFAGLLCGYPMGAKTCADLVQKQKISQAEAQYLLCFTNNPSPAFVISYICDSVLKTPTTLPFLLAIYTAPLLAGFIYHIFQHTKYKEEKKTFFPYLPNRSFDLTLVDNAIMNSFETVTKLGGYIILFSILASFIKNLDSRIIHEPLRYFLLALTEISTGIHYLGNSILKNSHLPIKEMAICACVSFGGLSGIAQTKSILKNTSLSILPYISSKLLISILSAILFYLYHIFL